MEKKRIVYALSCIVLVLMVYASCRHKPVIPDSPQVSYNDKIKPIIDANCATSDCHGQGGEEIQLTTYFAVSNFVVPGNAHQSELYQLITTLSGENKMPPSQPLSEQQIILIYTWIMQGAKNN